MLLSACSTAPKKSVDEILSDAFTAQTDVDVTADIDETSTEFYIRTAIKNEGLVSNEYLLHAAELLYAKIEASPDTASPTQPKTERTQRNRRIQIQLIAARIALISNIPLQALELLPETEFLSINKLAESNAIRAQALLKMNRYMDSIRAHIQSEQLTKNAGRKEHINQSIWSLLSSLPNVTLERSNTTDITLKGWIELALIMRSAQTEISWLQDDILDWGTSFPLHPVSNKFLNELLDGYISNYSTFKNIAVLLPTSGKYQSVAEVIRNGILSAYYEQNEYGIKPTIRFYDTSGSKVDINALYARAVKDGADIVIGPMEKSNINLLVKQKEFNVPILTLNYANSTNNTPINLFQFGLLPEDEAKQVAELAILKNQRNAAVLVPDSEWGKRVALAFKTRYETMGGRVLSQQTYTPGVDDFSKPIQALLNLDNSKKRYKRVKRLLKTDLKFTPHRRQDIDMLFVVATHRAARGIMPALKFHHASDIQAYATSHVYTGHVNKAADRDLNGLIFSDIPWTIVSRNKLRKTFRKNWKNKSKYTRLYALGIDAYSLIRNLRYLKKHDNAYFIGETGNISIDKNNRIHRKLVWAKFRRGRPVYITPSIAIPTDTDS